MFFGSWKSLCNYQHPYGELIELQRLYLYYQPYNPKKRSLNTGEILLLYYINVLVKPIKFRSKALNVRSKALNVRSEALNGHSEALNRHFKARSGDFHN